MHVHIIFYIFLRIDVRVDIMHGRLTHLSLGFLSWIFEVHIQSPGSSYSQSLLT